MRGIFIRGEKKKKKSGGCDLKNMEQKYEALVFFTNPEIGFEIPLLIYSRFIDTEDTY